MPNKQPHGTFHFMPCCKIVFMRKPYKTQKRKQEFKSAYEEIGSLNRNIINYEIEIESFINNSNSEEAAISQDKVNSMKLRLLELSKEGWDIEYITPMSSGLEVKTETPELK